MASEIIETEFWLQLLTSVSFLPRSQTMPDGFATVKFEITELLPSDIIETPLEPASFVTKISPMVGL